MKRNLLAIFDDLDGKLARPEMRYLHPMSLGVWSYLTTNIYLPMPPEYRAGLREGFEQFEQPFTKALHDKGARLMAGTDALVPVTLPGFSLHRELEELVDVGLTPYEALRTSTTQRKSRKNGWKQGIGSGHQLDAFLMQGCREGPLERFKTVAYRGAMLRRHGQIHIGREI